MKENRREIYLTALVLLALYLSLAENFIPCLGTKSVEHEHDCYAGCGKVCGSVYEYER